MHQVGVISAPMSMQNRRAPRMTLELERVLGRRGLHAVTNSFDELTTALREFMFSGVEVIAVNGGDGTLSHVVTRALDIYGRSDMPSITPLRGGNLNVMADNLKIHGRPVQLLGRLMNGLENRDKNLKRRNFFSMRIGNQVGFLFTVGTCSRFLEEFYENKSNPIASLALILKLAVSKYINPAFFNRVVRADETDILIGGRRIYSDTPVNVFCATIPRLPFGPKLFPNAGSQHEEISCVTFDCEAKDTFVRGVCDAVVRPKASPWRSVMSAPNMELRVPAGSSYSLDGEVFHTKSGHIDIEIGPQFSFLAV